MKRATMIIAGLTIGLAGRAALAEEVASKERTFRVKYADGEVERYKVSYSAIRDMSQNESGGPSTLTHPIDDRQCHWSITGRIERKVWLVNRNGKAFEEKDKYVAYNNDFANRGTDFSIATFRPGNCNDTRDRRDSDYNDTRARLIGALDATIEADMKKVADEYRKNGEVITQ